MATQTEIANMAFALLGQPRVTDVTTDTSERAKWVQELWANSRDEALRAFPWNFATWRVGLGENLLTRSEAFDHADWTKTNASVTADQVRAPDGQSAGDELDDSDGANAGTVAQAATVPNNSDSHTLSIYLKQGTAAATRIQIAYSGGTGTEQNGDITWGATPTISGGTAEDVGGGWWRFHLTLANNANGNTTLTVTIYPAGSTASATGTVYAWGAQLSQNTGQIAYASAAASARRPIFPPFEFQYGWPLPSDFLRVVDVNYGRDRWKIEGGYLLIDSDDPLLRYVRQITDVAEFDNLFSRALAAQLARDLMIVLTGSDERMGRVEREWRRAVGAARTTDSQEEGQDRPLEPTWIQARRAGFGV